MEPIAPSDYFLLYVVLFLFLVALIVASLIIVALRHENNGKIKPNNALNPPVRNAGSGDRYQEKRAAITALRADIDLALYTLELEGKTSVHQCQIAVQQVYQGWQKKYSSLFPSAQGRIAVLGKKAGMWSYKLPGDLESLVVKLAA